MIIIEHIDTEHIIDPILFVKYKINFLLIFVTFIRLPGNGMADKYDA